MNRRDFLRPRSLAYTASQIYQTLREVSAPQDAAQDHDDVCLLHFTRRAMATTFEVLLPAGTPSALSAAEAALDEIDRLESQLSVYRDDSEMSRLNRTAPSGPVPVEERLFRLLQQAAHLTERTEGAFDVTAGPLIKTWGFYRRQGRVPTEQERAEALQRVGMGHVEFDETRRTIHYRTPGVEINLGSIGKGYALDRAGALLRQHWGVGSALLHGGFSSILALGSQPGEQRGWPVGLRHPWRPDVRLALVWLRGQALGTSAATFQHLEYNGRKLGHILDPRTGWPAEGLASASALAPTAAEADALATAFYLQGLDWTRRYCEARPGIGAVLLPAGPYGQPVVVGLSPEEIDLRGS